MSIIDIFTNNTYIAMKYYLSSYKLGNDIETFKKLYDGKKIAFIPNALDHVEEQARHESNRKGIKNLTDIGVDGEVLDLALFFNKADELKEKMQTFDGVWVRGGNTFVLRQAMKLSSFDTIIKQIERDDFVYGGYSAGICILAPTLDALHIVDDPNTFPYKECKTTVWDGLGILDYIILPHYKSDYPEAADIDKAVEYCEKNNVAFTTLRDGEVIVIE